MDTVQGIVSFLGLPVTAYDRTSRGAVAYKEMAAEIADRI